MTEINASNLDETIAATPALLVYVFTPRCGPCNSLAPVLDELAGEFADRISFVKLNALADEESTMKSAALGVGSVPTLILFKNGIEVARRTGVPGKAELSEWIESFLGE